MHLLEFCAAAPFTCFYVCLILFSFLVCLQLFTCIPARCSKIYQQDFQRFQCQLTYNPRTVLLSYQFDVSTAVEIVKRFSFSLRVLLSMKFGFKKVFQKNGNVLEHHQSGCSPSQHRHNQVSFLLFSWFSAYFWYLLSINFGFKKLLRKLMIALLGQNKQVNWVIVYYFTYLRFFFVLFELKICSMPLAHITTRPLTILFH